MAMTKRKTLALLLAALGLIGVAGRAKPPEAKPAAVNAPPRDEHAGTRLDDDGDPLPPGAVRRLGTLRFRQGGGLGGWVFPRPDGKTLISGFYCGDRTICLWDLETGKMLRSFPTGYENILFALSPDGRTLVETHQWGRGILLWDVASGKESGPLEWKDGSCWPESFAFSQDGKTLAVGGVEGSIDLWDLTTRKHTANWKTPKEAIWAVAFTPDGKTLVATVANTITLWDVASGKETQTLTRPKEISFLAVSPDGALFASGGKEDGIALWDISGGKVVHEWPATRSLSSLTFSPDGKTLATTEGADDYDTIVLRDVKTGKERQRIKAPGVFSAAFSTDGKTLITAHIGGTIRLWDADTGKERTPTTGNQRVCSATLSPDGRTLAFIRDKARCFDTGEILFWDMAAGREIGELLIEPGETQSLAFTPDGKSLASVDGPAIRLWDVGARKLLRRLDQDKDSDNPYSAVAFAPDGKTLAIGEGDGSVRVRDPVAGKELRRLTLTIARNTKEAWPGWVAAVAFAPDDRKLAALAWTHEFGVKMRLWDSVIGNETPRLVWETTTADRINDPEKDFLVGGIAIPSFLFSPDGRLLAVNRMQKTIPVWEAATGQERLMLTGHKEATCCIAIAPDGRTLASSSFDDTIRLWDLETGDELRTLTGHRSKANSLVFSKDSKTLVSTGDDTTLMFWDVDAITHRPRPKTTPLSAEKCESFWTDLADADAAKAYRAVRAFAACPTAAAFLGPRLQPAPTAKQADLDRWIADLDNDDFDLREKATHALEDLGEAAGPALRKMTAGRPSPEAKSRADRLLAKLAVPSPELLRELRGVEALESNGGSGGRQVLERLAKGAAESRLTREAKASLERLGR